MDDPPYLILDCYFDELGAAPNFRALLGGAPSETVRAVKESIPTDISEYAGVIITGSKACLSSPEPWMEALLDCIRHARDIRKPVLGVCFGHQAVAAALWGSEGVRLAVQSELGWETIRLDQPNLIVGGLKNRFTCFVSHFDEVTPGLAGMNIFASSLRCPVQGFQMEGEQVWGMQFHPEMDPGESEALVRGNLARHTGLGNDPEAVLASRRDGRDLGAQIFANFVRACSPD
ncbi:MAG: GMP synthase (glutamine-hydrolyzing) [Planctomycetota bacterium]|jgi:GMP synthase (glutamine-hydrolysing)